MALLSSLPLPLGTPIIDFHLPGIDGSHHQSSDYADRKVLVVIFMCNHCPYVQAVIDRLIALQASYAPTEVQLVGINANDWENYPEDTPEKMKEYAQKWGMNFPYLYDESQETAKAYQAQCTPDIYVFNQGRTLAYHGRIDDNWKEPEKVTQQELASAIDALLRHEQPSPNQNPTIGCSIKWRA